MANLQAFMPQGYSALVAATSSTAYASTPLGSSSPTTAGHSGIQGCLVYNSATMPVYVAFAPTSAVQAACPTTDLPATGCCVGSSQSQIFSIPPNAWISAATSGSSGVIRVTPGFGT